jgi:8-oxo-dGTP pyrophosphatase MutT (NUDIX family)
VTELVERVDDEDHVLGVVGRDEAVRHGWLHRIAATVCRDEGGRFLVSRRAGDLSRFPGYHEVTFGGAVNVGESYRAAAARELAEELGVHVPVVLVVKFLCQGEIGPYWLGVHEAVITGDVAPDALAVSWVGWMNRAELNRAMQQHCFIPDGQEALRRYLGAREASPGSVR